MRSSFAAHGPPTGAGSLSSLNSRAVRPGHAQRSSVKQQQQDGPSAACAAASQPAIRRTSSLSRSVASIASSASQQSLLLRAAASSVQAPTTEEEEVQQEVQQEGAPAEQEAEQQKQRSRKKSSSSDSASSAGSTGDEAEDGSILAKFLVNTAWATAIIGRGGSNVRQLTADTGARVQLSNKDAFHPGTRSRVLLLRGQLKEIEAALVAVLAFRDELPLQKERGEEIKSLK